MAVRLEDNTSVWPYLLTGGWVLLVLAPLVRIPLYLHLNLYNRLWRYASTEEINGILKASLIAPLIIGLINFGILPLLRLPYSSSRSIWLLEATFSLLTLTGVRFTLRYLHQRASYNRLPAVENANIPTLIVGAGDTGATILREIQRNPHLGVHIVGCIDDNPRKLNYTLFGVPVLGDRQMLPDLVQQHNIRQVIIAMPTASGKVIRQVVQMCEKVNIRPRIVPRLDALVSGNLLISQLRAVEIDDLLRREPVATDTAGMVSHLQNRRVLVTGGGGSIGSELCRQILRCHPAELVILGHGENSVFEIEQELSQLALKQGGGTRIITRIADIRMADRIDTVFRQCRPEVVFHAAAHKHVPLMEDNPCEAITNNILGTRNVLQAAQSVNVSHFVMVSTDKAVNPTSVMGASKRAAELLVLEAARRTGKPYVTVRFGNVLGSRGSVVLTFKRQIALGGPITITHRDVRRFFMTIPEAVELLLQAAILGHGGEVFMLDMGEAVRIVDLAKDLIRLSGLEVDRDIDIVFTGLRPGEKLYEELFLPGENYETTAHPKIRIAANARNYVPEFLYANIANLSVAAQDADVNAMLGYLAALVPEYQPPKDVTALPTSKEQVSVTAIHPLLPMQLSSDAAD